MTEPSWWSYFKRVAGTETGRVIAEAAQVSEPQVSRWKTGKNRPDAEALITFARHFGRPPVEAIVAAGYLNADEVGAVVDVTRPIGDLGNNELLKEVQRRMESVSTLTQFADILRRGGALHIGPAVKGASFAILQEEDGTRSVALYLPADNVVIDSRSDRSLDPSLPIMITRTADEEETDDITTEPPTEVRTSEAPEGQKTRGRGSLPDKIRDTGERLTTTRTGRAVADNASALAISQPRETSDDVLRVSYDAPPSVRARAIRIEMDGSVHAEPEDIPVSAGTVEGALQELLDRYTDQGFEVDTDTRAADKGADLFAHGKQFDLAIELKSSGSQFGPPADFVQAARQYAMNTRNGDVQAASDAGDRQSDYELAHRRGRGKTKGELEKEAADRRGEEGDPDGPEEGV
ncbi:transcriptional regulator [Gordonia phage Agueybana]|uniref:Immunity repressor n=1 Tax=Gordonia phage Agueybana TaxID=2859634 RepID=A0AC61N9Q0_9CAUD|nr:transcriptional regulator [Gordonia phage Agueybana]QYC54604.1 immunity repressor [Gordonia phage Agueybana]